MSDPSKPAHDGFHMTDLLGERPSLGVRLLRILLTPFAWLHQAWLEIYLLVFRVGWRKRYRVRRRDGTPVPVISIGNLVSGGTGKTPMAQLVAGALHRDGHRVVILSRGHGGSGSAAGSSPRVVSDGAKILLGPEEAGDEPLLLAQSLPGIPVIIGRDRRRSARFAVAMFAPDVIVLDDALQYWQLHRDLDIVLLDARSPFGNGYVLPRGPLREPPSHLARAGIVVITRADAVSAEELSAVRTRAQGLAPNAAIFTATHAPIGWARPSEAEVTPLDAFAGRRAFVFSAIADNAAFLRSIQTQGITVTETAFFGDHHAYGRTMIDDLAQRAVAAGAPVVLTTEKDLVKVAPLWPPDAPEIYALRIGLAVSDERAFFPLIGEVFVRQ